MPIRQMNRGSSEKKSLKKLFTRERNQTSCRDPSSIPAGPPSPSARIMSVLWKKAKTKDLDVVAIDVEETSGDFTTMEGASPPLDQAMIGFFDSETISVDEGSTSEDALRVKIVKDQLKTDLLELMRSNKGNVRLLEEIESDTVTPETVNEAFGDARPIEKNVAFLWCAFMRRPDLLATLQELGAEVDYCEPQEGFSALHLSAFSGCTTCVKQLLAAGVAADYALKNYTPLHCAAFGNSVGTAQLLLGNGANADVVGCRGDVVVGTAIRSAVKANAVECVQLLARYTSDINATEPTGTAVAHVAADLGHLECLAAILSTPRVDADVKTRDKRNTPLHLAAEGGNATCLAALLAHGAAVNAVNAKGQTALHLAAKTQSVECVEMLLKVGRCNPNVVDNDHRTPLHCAMGREQFSVEVAQLLIDSWKGQVNAADNCGYTPLHIASINKLSQCVDLLLLNNADVTARTKGGLTALNLIAKKTPGCLVTVSDMLDKAISMHEPENARQEVELTLNFRCVLPRIRGRNEISFLNTFVEEGHKELLEHPLCEAFLYLKWQKVRKYYIWRLVFCGFFVLWLTGYVMTALAHSCYNEGRNVSGSGVNSTCDNPWELKIKDNPYIVDIQWYLLVVFTLVETIRKLYCVGGYATWRKYFSEVGNYLEWFVIAGIFAISCVYFERTYAWQKYVGAFSVLFAWINFMFMVGQLPALGSYVAMYTKVQREFAKLLLAYVCLLVGFTVSFCVIFPAQPEFANPMISFLYILVMMTGEVSLEPLLKVSTGNVDWQYATAFVLYLSFLLMVTVVLMNLLVGIAVNDIQGLKKTAGLSKLVQQTQLISYMEGAMFNKRLPAYVLKVLSSTSQFAYRVVLEVKPLNPGETRLPKEVLVSAYELAKSLRHGGPGKESPMVGQKFSGKRRLAFLPKKGLLHKFGRQGSTESMQSEAGENALTLTRLAGEMREMRDMMRKLVDALPKKE